MNSWQTQVWSARIFDGLIIASLIGLSILFYWTPQTLDRFRGLFRTTNHAVIAAPAVEEKPAAQPIIRKTARGSRGGPDSRTPVVTESDSAVEALPKQTLLALPEAKSDPSQASIKTEAAAMYATNSSRSPIVRLLKKGDRVESNLEVIDSKGRWSLVQTNELSRPGFVRSEDLERQKTSAAKEQTPN